MPRLVFLSMNNVIFALLSAATPILSQAAEPESRPTYHVHFAELNLDSAAGTEALYQRIRRGAEVVCRSLEGRGISQQASHGRCEEEAIGRAVTQVGHPRLTAYYSKLNHGKAPSAAFNARNPDGMVRVVAGH
jgi:UrcA family protein